MERKEERKKKGGKKRKKIVNLSKDMGKSESLCTNSGNVKYSYRDKI